jgi:hypothetical protein
MKPRRGKWNRTGIRGGGELSSGLMTISSGVRARRVPNVGLDLVSRMAQNLVELEARLTHFVQYHQERRTP